MCWKKRERKADQVPTMSGLRYRPRLQYMRVRSSLIALDNPKALTKKVKWSAEQIDKTNTRKESINEQRMNELADRKMEWNGNGKNLMPISKFI